MSAWDGSSTSDGTDSGTSHWYGLTSRIPRASSKALRSKEVEQVFPSIGKKAKLIISSILGYIGLMGAIQTFKTFLLPLLIALPISVGVGFVLAVVSYFVLGTVKSKRTVKITNKTSVEMLDAAESKLLRLRNVYMNNSFDSRIFKDVLQEICDSTEKIIEQLIERPELIFQSRDFLGYYLDTIMTILDGYNKIEDINEQVEQTRKISKIFKSMSVAFDEKVKNFEKNNLDGLNVEIKLLQAELGQKGITDVG